MFNRVRNLIFWLKIRTQSNKNLVEISNFATKRSIIQGRPWLQRTFLICRESKKDFRFGSIVSIIDNLNSISLRDRNFIKSSTIAWSSSSSSFIIFITSFAMKSENDFVSKYVSKYELNKFENENKILSLLLLNEEHVTSQDFFKSLNNYIK